jgi:hypothetical protein
MTPERLRELVEMTELDLRTLAARLGYSGYNSLNQCLRGTATLSPGRAAWLERYAKFRAKQTAADEAWREKNPPPR